MVAWLDIIANTYVLVEGSEWQWCRIVWTFGEPFRALHEAQFFAKDRKRAHPGRTKHMEEPMWGHITITAIARLLDDKKLL